MGLFCYKIFCEKGNVMEILFIVLGVVGVILVLLLAFLLVIYFMCFYNPVKNKGKSQRPLTGPQYTPFDNEMNALIENVKKIPYEDAWIRSYDNKKLHAKVYINDVKKPFAILVHGYRGSGLRDFAGGLGYYISQGFNAILIDHRGHGESDGKTITFGIKERKDLVSWINYAIDTYGKDIEILLTGISMGGATVLMVLDQDLPPNVKCVISDCPFSSPLGIILKVTEDMHLPSKLCKPFIKLSARLFAHVNIEESDSFRSIKDSKLPILIIHGTEDRYVPVKMSEELKSSNPNVELLEIEGAPHGLSFIKDNAKYTSVAKAFIDRYFK